MYFDSVLDWCLDKRCYLTLECDRHVSSVRLKFLIGHFSANWTPLAPPVNNFFAPTETPTYCLYQDFELVVSASRCNNGNHPEKHSVFALPLPHTTPIICLRHTMVTL